MKDIETADTILSGAFDQVSEEALPDWDALLPKTYLHEGAATLVLEQGATIKPSSPSSPPFTNTHSIRLGDQQLDLPRHSISPMSPSLDFEILSTLGRGGMGVVHLARQQALRRLLRR